MPFNSKSRSHFALYELFILAMSADHSLSQVNFLLVGWCLCMLKPQWDLQVVHALKGLQREEQDGLLTALERLARLAWNDDEVCWAPNHAHICTQQVSTLCLKTQKAYGAGFKGELLVGARGSARCWRSGGFGGYNLQVDCRASCIVQCLPLSHVTGPRRGAAV